MELSALVTTHAVRLKLYQKALDCFSKIEPADELWYNQAQELIQLCQYRLEPVNGFGFKPDP